MSNNAKTRRALAATFAASALWAASASVAPAADRNLFALPVIHFAEQTAGSEPAGGTPSSSEATDGTVRELALSCTVSSFRQFTCG
jgi:hypothetical protein